MHVCVLSDERQILPLLLGKADLLLPTAVNWAEDVNHVPIIKDNDVFFGRVIAGFHQPMALSFALLLGLVHCIFTEVYLAATVTEIG